MVDDWGSPEPTLPDAPNPADDEDFRERMIKLDEGDYMSDLETEVVEIEDDDDTA